MRVKIQSDRQGPGPSESLIGIMAADGATELVIVSRRAIQDGAIDVGNPLIIKDGNLLIELPRESTSGRWRIWISQSEVAEPSMVAAE